MLVYKNNKMVYSQAHNRANAKYRKAPLLEPTLQKRSSSRTRSSEFLIISEASSTSSGV